VMTAHAVQVAARAGRTREDHHQLVIPGATTGGEPRPARRVCGRRPSRLAAAALPGPRPRSPGRDPRTGRTQPGRRDVSAPQACVPARPLDGTGLTSREITQTV
jgi:hypothetical protein